jgi:hypothetical protein
LRGETAGMQMLSYWPESAHPSIRTIAVCKAEVENLNMAKRKKAQKMREESLADSAVRGKLWQEYLTNYQRELSVSPQVFQTYSADIREQYLLDR